jgi:cytochrome c oxidase cbb3-type subunit 4
MTLDINDIRAVLTLVSLLAFLGIVIWAYSARRRAGFEAAAQAVLDDNDEQEMLAEARGERK